MLSETDSGSVERTTIRTNICAKKICIRKRVSCGNRCERHCCVIACLIAGQGFQYMDVHVHPDQESEPTTPQSNGDDTRDTSTTLQQSKDKSIELEVI